MGTSASLNVKIGDRYLSVTTHCDGYPKYMLPILNNHYNTLDLVLQLVSRGCMSVLREEIINIDYYNPRENADFNNVKLNCKPIDNTDYVYIFRLNGGDNVCTGARSTDHNKGEWVAYKPQQDDDERIYLELIT